MQKVRHRAAAFSGFEADSRRPQVRLISLFRLTQARKLDEARPKACLRGFACSATLRLAKAPKHSMTSAGHDWLAEAQGCSMRLTRQIRSLKGSTRVILSPND